MNKEQQEKIKAAADLGRKMLAGVWLYGVSIDVNNVEHVLACFAQSQSVERKPEKRKGRA